MTTPARIRVDLPGRGYDILIGPGLLASLGDTTRRAVNPAAPSRAFLAFDANLPRPTIDRATASLSASGLTPITHALTATEEHKSLPALERLLTAIASARLDRREPLIALGGGIIGDLAGFAAATYRRGVPLIHCPTTLLSMVDASVGGKTGVNLAVPSRADSSGSTDSTYQSHAPSSASTLLKNMVGAFWQPRVLADTDTLSSLPPRIFRAGLAECIKHAMLSATLPAPHADPDLLDWTESALPRILAHDAAALTELISRNVRIKAAIVARDEREEDDSGGRALLNLGHTFAHAIETIPHLSPDNNPAHAPLQHGEAVALGLIAAATTAASAKLAPADLPARITRLIAASGLPTRVHNLPPADQIMGRMAHDKKVLAGHLRVILPTAPGHAAIFTDPLLQAVQAGLRAITG